MLRIINKGGMFLRDDFSFDVETEIGLEVEPAQGFYHPKWDGRKWVEGKTQAEIDAIKVLPIDNKSVAMEKINVATTVTTLKKAMLEYLNAE